MGERTDERHVKEDQQRGNQMSVPLRFLSLQSRSGALSFAENPSRTSLAKPSHKLSQRLITIYPDLTRPVTMTLYGCNSPLFPSSQSFTTYRRNEWGLGSVKSAEVSQAHCVHLTCTQWCIFLSQEVREIRSAFSFFAARVSPLRLGDFHARISNSSSKLYTTEYFIKMTALRVIRLDRRATLMKWGNIFICRTTEFALNDNDDDDDESWNFRGAHE